MVTRYSKIDLKINKEPVYFYLISSATNQKRTKFSHFRFRNQQGKISRKNFIQPLLLGQKKVKHE